LIVLDTSNVSFQAKTALVMFLSFSHKDSTGIISSCLNMVKLPQLVHLPRLAALTATGNFFATAIAAATPKTNPFFSNSGSGIVQ
jgi:hypothetical protein